MAVKSDQKKDALLAEVKVAFEKEKTKVERRINELDAEKNGVDRYKKDLKQESLQLREQVDALEYHNKELASKNRQLQEFLTAKEYECDNLVKENEHNKKSLKTCSLELEQIKESQESTTTQMKKNLSDLKIESGDLAELVKTKERMLEDQMQQIAALKQQLVDKDEELNESGDAKNKYRDFYEDKLAIEIEATERAKAKQEDLQIRLNEVEDENENMR